MYQRIGHWAWLESGVELEKFPDGDIRIDHVGPSFDVRIEDESGLFGWKIVGFGWLVVQWLGVG